MPKSGVSSDRISLYGGENNFTLDLVELEKHTFFHPTHEGVVHVCFIDLLDDVAQRSEGQHDEVELE